MAGLSRIKTEGVGDMTIRRVGFVGSRTNDVRAMASFFGDVLGLESVRNDPDWAILQLPTGTFDFVEIYGSAFNDERLAPADAKLFVAFIVDDLEAAHTQAKSCGAEPSDIVLAREVFDQPAYGTLGWFFLRAPDGNVYVIQQDTETVT